MVLSINEAVRDLPSPKFLQERLYELERRTPVLRNVGDICVYRYMLALKRTPIFTADGDGI